MDQEVGQARALGRLHLEIVKAYRDSALLFVRRLSLVLHDTTLPTSTCEDSFDRQTLAARKPLQVQPSVFWYYCSEEIL